MANYTPYNQSQAFQPYQISQYFPQPQGSIYMIGSSNDIANVPVGAGLSAAICLREGIMYLKTVQNGSPMLLGYRLSSLENNTAADPIQTPQTTVPESQPSDLEKKNTSMFENLSSRLEKLEQGSNKTKGGTSEWPL